ncbi:MAG: hypothetical protein EOO73_06735, partial [Myxococcales bacterium]
MENASQGGRMMRQRAGRRSAFRRCSWLFGAAVLALACERPEYTYDPDRPLDGGTGAFGNFGGAGTVGTGGALSTGAAGSAPGGAGACLLDRPVTSPAFSKQAISNQLPARQVVYALMTDDEVEELKATRALLPKPAVAAPSSALSSLLLQLQNTASELRKPLLQELVKRFRVTRTTWPNPWALRLVEHPSSQHMNPVRITFKEDAWVVRLFDGSPSIVNLSNQIVTITAAMAEPERIAAIYYVADDRSAGAVATCETGKRELALGNPDMVEEFAIGTPEILEQLDADIASLEALFNVSRPCSSVDRNGMTFHAFTVCQSWRFFDASTEFLAYQWALANPVESYKPTSQNLATLIQALKDDRFEPDPFVGIPLPAVGEGGAGRGMPTNGSG